MPARPPSLLNGKALNGWGLFCLVVVPMSVAVVAAMASADLSSGRDISSLITFSVRLAVPWLFIAFAASSLVVLLPGVFSRWLLRNRRIVGLLFAAGMAWQLFFILWLVTGHFELYMEESYSFHSLVEQVPGYIVLIAMTVTSFKPGRSKLSSKQWKVLHKGSIYFLWAVLFSTYWYELFYYDDIQAIDYVYYWMGFGAWALRMAAWSKKRVLLPAT